VDTRILIDAIVQQTTALIAQLSTAAGIRAPLAHVADQVFVDLAREIERQGVGRKVVADMFGLALRSYQRKVQRLTESVSVRGRTLWGAVHAFISERERVDRAQIAEHFARDPEEHVAAVLNDLVSSGLVYATGRGIRSVYRVVTQAEQRAHAVKESEQNLVHLAWLTIHRELRIHRSELARMLAIDAAVAARAVERLAGEQRVTISDDDDPWLEAAEIAIPVGGSRGWEVAVRHLGREPGAGDARWGRTTCGTRPGPPPRSTTRASASPCASAPQKARLTARPASTPRAYGALLRVTDRDRCRLRLLGE